MQTITRKAGDFDDLVFEVNLTGYAKKDISDIVFSVKELLTDDDALIFEKKKSTGGITNTGIDIITVSVKWAYNEYDKFTINKNYNAGLFIKFAGDPVFDEHVDTTFKLIVTQDFLRK